MRRLAPGYTQPIPHDDPSIPNLRRLGILPDGWKGTLHRGRQETDGPQDGESGRMAVYEVMTVTDPLRQMIEDSTPQTDIAARLDREFFVSLADYSRMLLTERYVAPERILEIFPKRAQFEEVA